MRIAHISDLHLRHHLPIPDSPTGDLSRLMPEYFARALARIASLNPDLLVVSGDLVDFPFERSRDPAVVEQGRQDYLLVADLLAQAPCPLAIVYGNHDLPDLFHAVFPAAPTDQIVAGHRILTFNDHEAPDHVPFRAGHERTRFLAALAGDDLTPQIHVQHFLIWPELDDIYPYNYVDGAWMRDQLAAAGKVRLTLSGHCHRNLPLQYEQGVCFGIAPAFVDPPHPWRVYDLANGEIRSRSFALDA